MRQRHWSQSFTSCVSGEAALPWVPRPPLSRAVRRTTAPEVKKAYHQLEIRSGLFERCVLLPQTICYEEAEATYADGFIVVRIPKCEEARELTTVVRLYLRPPVL